MERRDEELLAKQLRGIERPQEGGLVGMAVAVFLVGLLVGGMVFAPPAQHTPAAPRALAAIPPTHVTPPVIR